MTPEDVSRSCERMKAPAVLMGCPRPEHINRTAVVSSQAFYERSDHDLVRGTAGGEFDADQSVASGQFQGSFWLRPTVGATYAYVDQEAFTDSTGTPIAGQITERGQLTFGPARSAFACDVRVNRSSLSSRACRQSVYGRSRMKATRRC